MPRAAEMTGAVKKIGSPRSVLSSATPPPQIRKLVQIHQMKVSRWSVARRCGGGSAGS
jgi:hypothetical protein